MIKHLINHQWKEVSRSKKFSESIGVKIAYWFFIGLILLYLLLAGLLIDKILEASFPGQDPVALFNGALLYYFAIHLFMRFYLQDVPVLSIVPYLHLPLKRSKMIHYMLSKSLLSLFNYLPLFIFIPFCLKVILPANGIFSAMIWLIGIFGLILMNNFLAIYLKRQLVGNFKVVIGFITAVFLFGVADFMNWINVSELSLLTFTGLGQNAIYLIVVGALLFLSYWVNYTLLRRNIYPEEIDHRKKTGDFKEINTSFLQRYGLIGSLIAMELKLIFRNKRPKSIFFISIVFLLYGLIFYPNKVYMEGFSMLIFVGVFITGIFLSNYGQLLLSWNSNFFDKIITSGLNMRKYFESKFWLFIVTSTAAFILSIPYVYFGWKVLIINLACYLFNIGVNAFVIFYFSMRNPKRVDLSKGATFNYEGVTATQFILILPVLLLPLLLVLPFQLFGIPYIGIALLAFMGITGLLLKDIWFGLIEKRYQSKKHSLAAGFREA